MRALSFLLNFVVWMTLSFMRWFTLRATSWSPSPRLRSISSVA